MIVMVKQTINTDITCSWTLLCRMLNKAQLYNSTVSLGEVVFNLCVHIVIVNFIGKIPSRQV